MQAYNTVENRLLTADRQCRNQRGSEKGAIIGISNLKETSLFSRVILYAPRNNCFYGFIFCHFMAFYSLETKLLWRK